MRGLSQYIQCASDSIETLRKCDVYRVLMESNDASIRNELSKYIKENRPDLIEEVDEVLQGDCDCI